jgi:hypothetical protein
MNARSSPEVRGKLQRSVGRCYDCLGQGKRKNIINAMVPCPTCNGSGKLDEYTVCMLAAAACLTIAKTYDALLDLEAQGIATRHLEGDTEWWRLGRASS